MQALPAPLSAMGNYRQFIVYFTQPSPTRPGKTDKFPCDAASGRIVGAKDPAYWVDANTAIESAARLGGTYGVGFVFTDNDPFFFVDLDDCVIDGQWSAAALDIMGMLPGAAIEISQSHRGAHIFGCGSIPEHGCKNEPLGLELYHTGRFVALTGINAVGNVWQDYSAQLPALIDKYFQPRANVPRVSDEAYSDGPADDWCGPTDDDDLIRRALRSSSVAGAFEGKATFADLWDADEQALARSYPDSTRSYNASQADAALAQHLAFWTGRDGDRIARLMERSALSRDKWDRDDYLPRTIGRACGQQFEVLRDKAPEPLADTPATTNSGSNGPARAAYVEGNTFLSIPEQVDLFAGCVYVRSLHRVLVPGGVLLKPEVFKVNYGGYTFIMDAANEKTTRDPWEAFTQSQAFRCPRVDSVAFKPDLEACAIVSRGGQTFVNTYWPIETPRHLGDASPFLNHLAKILPDERDAMILLCYMAACVQHKGVKFQWAPLLQGVEGNGKTLFTRCVAEAIGSRYVHWPKASKLCNQFNSWMVGKLFFGVEDIYVPNHKREIIEELKPMITGGDGLEIEGKGIDQISADICGNFMFNSNHKDAYRKTQNDRRFCVLFSAQQQAADIVAAGMGGDYFPNLYGWLREGGYAVVSELLHTMAIPDALNPAKDCQRAPVTTSTAEAISLSAGGIEQEVLEAVAQGAPGFAGGWISSIQLEHLLSRIGAARNMPHTKRREMLDAMGYVPHPALPDGRVHNVVLPDGGKPRLFVLKDSLAAQLTVPADAAKNYEQTNNTGRTPFPSSLPRGAHP